MIALITSLFVQLLTSCFLASLLMHARDDKAGSSECQDVVL